MSHDTPCHSVVWHSRGRRDGTPENKNIHICVWSKVDGLLIGDITGVFLLYFGPLRTFRNSWGLVVAVWQGFYIGYIGKANCTLAKAGGRRGWRSSGRRPTWSELYNNNDNNISPS